jgi:hypothetical protein
MFRRSIRYAFGSAVIATGLMAATVPSAQAERSPGIDDTYVIDVCPFPIEVHEIYRSFNEILLPHEIQDHRIGYSVDFTNPDTGTTWHVEGNPVSSFVFNPDGSVIQTVDGVWIAAGPLHTVYFGHWTRTFPDGVFGPVPFEGQGKTVDICERMR